MALESANALAALDAAVRVHAPRDGKLPQLDSLVQTTANQVATVGRKGNRVHAVLVAVGVLQTFHQVASGGIPDSHTLVQRAGCHVVAIGRHGHGSDTVLDAQGVDELAIQDIPQTNSLVTTARGNVATVASKVQGVDILLVTAEDMLDGACSNIPNL